MELNYLYKDELYISLEEDREPADGPRSRAETETEQFGPDWTGLVSAGQLLVVFCSQMFLP